jgi:hypothetical protein
MAKRRTKEQREADEIEELRKQLAMAYVTATNDDWLTPNVDAFITPEHLFEIMWAVRVAFNLPSDHNMICHSNVRYYENPTMLAEEMYERGIRAWTKLEKKGTP